MNPLLLLALASLNGAALGVKKSMISNVGNFYSFLEHVNSGADYSGSTVYLTKDLDFSSEPPLTISIGFNLTAPFRGLFVADGYVISGLSINRTISEGLFTYGGLFGVIMNATISGLVMDESCSITGPEGPHGTIFGGLAGYSQTSTIRDCVNMASLTFSERKIGILAGGLIGQIVDFNIVRNSVNYGSITVSGDDFGYANIGGIAATLPGGCTGRISYITNCANFGDITLDAGKIEQFRMAGIIGFLNCLVVYIENCVIGGKLTNTTKGTLFSHVGSVIGHHDDVYTEKSSLLKNIYWSTDIGYDNTYGALSFFTNITVENCGSIDLSNRYTLPLLNYLPSTDSTYTFWKNIPGRGGKFITGKSYLVTTGKAFPSPKMDGYVFLHWCTDSALTKKYRPFTTEITNTTSLLPKYAEAVTAIFDFGNGTQVTQEVPYASEYGKLPNSNKIGHTFNGWFTEKDGNGEEVTSYTNVSTKDTRTLYGYWTPNNYTVTFVFNNGDADEVKKFPFESTIVYPEDPVKDKYTFAGWEPKPDKMPGENIVIEAKWESDNITVTFDAGEIEVTQKTKIVTYTKLYGELPSVGERTGYTFAGWFTEEEEGQGERVTEETTVPIRSDHTLYAHWTINSYTVTFIINNGADNEEVSFNFNETIVYPVNMTKEGHSFNGWVPKPERIGAEDINVTAQWSINSYSVTFVFGNGDADKVVVLTYGEAIVYPKDVSGREGYTFGGWDKDVKTMPGHNITISVQWDTIKYSVKFILNNGEDPIVKLFAPNETIAYPENVVRKGYTFDGWFPKPEVMGAKNITVVAQWVEGEIPMPGASLSSSEVVEEGVLVEVVLVKGNFKPEEIEELVREYTKEKFTVESTEIDKSTGEISVIVKFQDKNTAESFVEDVNNNAGSGSFIKEAKIHSGKGSLAAALCPMVMLVGLIVGLF